MDHRRLLCGCLLAFCGIGAASAMDVDTHTLAGVVQRATFDGGSRDGGSLTASPGHDPAPSSSNAMPADSQDGDSDLDSAHPQGGHHGSLGWQSLLPGSIQ